MASARLLLIDRASRQPSRAPITPDDTSPPLHRAGRRSGGDEYRAARLRAPRRPRDRRRDRCRRLGRHRAGPSRPLSGADFDEGHHEIGSWLVGSHHHSGRITINDLGALARGTADAVRPQARPDRTRRGKVIGDSTRPRPHSIAKLSACDVGAAKSSARQFQKPTPASSSLPRARPARPEPELLGQARPTSAARSVDAARPRLAATGLPMPAVTTAICAQCELKLAASDSEPIRSCATGFDSSCVDCHKEATRRWRTRTGTRSTRHDATHDRGTPSSKQLKIAASSRMSSREK